jgi:RNA-dependent RNA polymerase
MTRSHRFARYLGSRRLLQIKIGDVYADLSAEREFLEQRFILCGRVFRPFAVKDGKVYAAEVNENYCRNSDNREGDQYRCSLEDIVGWHNPLYLNSGQVGVTYFEIMDHFLC